MDHFPVFLDLKGRRCLVVGGGDGAAAKAAQLARAGAQVAIVAATLSPALRDAVRCGAATHLARQFAPSLLVGAVLVMVADETRAVSEAVSVAARARRIPVNVTDDVPLSSFIMPAIVDRAAGDDRHQHRRRGTVARRVAAPLARGCSAATARPIGRARRAFSRFGQGAVE